MAMLEARLNPKEERRLLRGHMWGFRNEFAEIPPLEDGALVDVVSSIGRFVGRAFYQAQGGIAVRILSHKRESIDADFLLHRIVRAQRFRERLFPDPTVYRWIFGESDGLPGFVADRYGAVVSAQSSCRFYEAHAEALAAAFLAQPGVEGVRLDVCGEIHSFGDVPSAVECELEGLRLNVDIEGGQKTGLFLDQRVNSRSSATFAPGARVLDGHCYVGLWSCHAAKAGAAHVLGVDTSAPAVERAQANAVLNGVADRCTFECADIAEVLGRGERYDVVLLDPPALAKSRDREAKALRLYQGLHKAAVQAVEPGGYLITSSCSHFVSREAFLETLKRAVGAAQRQAWVVDVRGPSPDHPVLMAMPETNYLTCVTLRVF